MEMMYDSKESRIKLPRNIKQVGKDEGNIKIYIEDYAYSFIRDIHVDGDEDGKTGVLLGDIINEGDITYVMIKGAAQVDNAAVFTDKIAFTDETWPVVNKMVDTEFAGMVIVGWYLVSSKITLNHMEVIKKADRENFKDEDDVFFMYNPSDDDESFYVKKNGWSLMDGFKVFYERNEQMQGYLGRYRKENQVESENEKIEGGQYRKQLKEGQVSKNVKRHLTVIYGLSMLLLIVVLIIGVNIINNKSTTSVPTKEAAADVTKEDRTVPVEEDTTPEETTPEETTPEPTTAEPTTPEPTTPEPTTPEPTTPKETKAQETKPQETTAAYQSYTIAQGDTLYKICEKFYGTASNANVKKILDYNGLSSATGLLVGDVIKIPQ